MKARIEKDGQIKLYAALPNDFENILNFRNADEETLKKYGFFDVITPKYDPSLYKLGNLYFDEKLEAFVYEVHNYTETELQLKTMQSTLMQVNNVEKQLIDSLLIHLIELHKESLPKELIDRYEEVRQQKLNL